MPRKPALAKTFRPRARTQQTPRAKTQGARVERRHAVGTRTPFSRQGLPGLVQRRRQRLRGAHPAAGLRARLGRGHYLAAAVLPLRNVGYDQVDDLAQVYSMSVSVRIFIPSAEIV